MKTLIWLTLLFSTHAFAFYGYKLSGYEATLPAHFMLKAESLEKASEKAQALARLHASFMIGSLMDETKEGSRGAISKNINLSEIKTSFASATEFRVDYQIDVSMILENKRNLKNFSVSLPLYPEDIYNQADRRCTGQYYYSGAEFVYFQFWSPSKRNCPLIPGKDFQDYEVNLKPRSSQTETYPRYDEMIQNNEVKLYFYFGSDYENLNRFGEAGKGFESLKYWLRKKKFTNVRGSNEWNKQLGSLKLTYNLLLGNPLPNTPHSQEEYFWFMKEAFETGSYVQYTGHAGHGGIMDLSALSEKFKTKVNYPQDKYQVYYINGCQTFVYATNYYPELKGGYKNLHMLLNGDVSWPDTTWTNLEAPLEQFYNYFAFGTRTSFQTMIDNSSLKMDRQLGAYRSSPMLVLEDGLN